MRNNDNSQTSTGGYRRVNILIKNEQYDQIQKAGLNLSGLVRDLIEFRFSDNRVMLEVTPETRALYDKAISNFGASDSELEPFFVDALDRLLSLKVREIEALRKKITIKKS